MSPRVQSYVIFSYRVKHGLKYKEVVSHKVVFLLGFHCTSNSSIYMIIHSCLPLLRVNLGPEFVNLCIPYAGQGLLFLAGGSSILTSKCHVWQWKERAMLCEIHMRDFKSHFWQDFLAYHTRPVSVYLAMACVSCLFDSFSIFLLSLKQQQNMKIMFSCIHFLVWPYPPNFLFYFFTCKLYGLTGMVVWEQEI